MRRLIAATIVLGVTSAIAQQLPPPQQPPPRDSRLAGGTGTAEIGGTIVASDQPPRPIAAAHVGVLGVDNGIVRLTSSDDSGRFLLANLPPGRYLVSAFKPPYVGMVYGSKAPGRPGTAVAIADGERRVDLVLPLTRGGVISGIVADDTGMPAANLGIAVIPAAGGSLQGQMMMAAFLPPQVTDDAGAYRVAGLLPGEYLVSVIRTDRAEPEAKAMTPADIDAALRLIQQPSTPPTPTPPARPTDTDVVIEPQPRGRGAAISSMGPLPMLSTMMMSSGVLMYAPVYYPGTVDISSAQPIRIAAGEERVGVDFVAPAIMTSRIHGTVIGPDGQPAPGASLRLRLPGQPELMALAGLGLTAGSGVAADGTFTLNGIAPGHYTLEARTYAQGVNPTAIAAGAAAGFTPPKPQFFASTEVVVTSGEALSGVELRLQPGSRLAGRVVFKPLQLSPPTDASSVMIALTPAVANDPLAMVGSGVTRPEADGTFSIDAIIPGRYVLTAAFVNPTQLMQWTPQSITVGGRDALDLPIDIKSGENIGDVVVAMGDARQEVHGTLQDEAGRPAPAFTILLFAVDRAYWLPNSRRVLATRPATNGRFSFAGPLGPPAGEYMLAALTDLDPKDQYTPSVLAEIAAAAIRITVAPGQQVRQDIRIR
jgi:hypothetical protein